MPASSAFVRTVIFLFGIVSISTPGWSDVTLPRVISDHMVLQREMAVPIWGTAEAAEKVVVKFRDQEKSTTAAADGKWMVQLDALKSGGPDTLTIQGNNKIEVNDVLVGEVWVGSGQSNMAGGAAGYAKGDEVLAKLVETTYPKLRLMKSRGGGAWQVAEPRAIRGFSALLFSFGQKLHEEVDVPVGLMLGAVGGTPSGRWLTQEMLDKDPGVQKLKQSGKVSQPKKVGDLYAAHIQSYVPFAIRGVLWDQGESGTALPGIDQYTTMGALIRGWRGAWGQGDFPFIYVQKPSGGGCAWDPKDPVTRMAQAFAAAPPKVPGDKDGLYRETHIKIRTYPKTAMATASDLGSGVHPRNKSGYGHRAVRVALGLAYGQDVEIYGPLYDSHTVEGDKVRIKFKHVGKGLASAHADKLQGFVVAGEDRQFHWAEAKIDGDTILVSSKDVARPVAVRYGWSKNRTWANLFNKDGLPALTFRSDNW